MLNKNAKEILHEARSNVLNSSTIFHVSVDVGQISNI